MRSVRAHGVVADIDTVLHAKDGRDTPVRMSGCVLSMGDGSARELVVVARSIAEHQQADQQRIAEHAVTRLLAESNTRASVMHDILQTICESLGWSYGAYWSPTPFFNAPALVLSP